MNNENVAPSRWIDGMRDFQWTSQNTINLAAAPKMSESETL